MTRGWGRGQGTLGAREFLCGSREHQTVPSLRGGIWLKDGFELVSSLESKGTLMDCPPPTPKTRVVF